MDCDNTIKPIYEVENFTIYHYGEVGSTADIVKNDFFKNITSNFIVVAENQTKSRGRGRKKWTSLQGNLFANIVIPICDSVDKYAQMSFVMSLVVSDIVTNLVAKNVKVEVKWPNDVLVDGAKICGILIELNANQLSIGVGLNIKSSPVVADYETCCLKDLGVDIDKSEILSELVARFNQWYNTWRVQGFEVILNMWKPRVKGLGRQIRVNLINEVVVGTFVSIDSEGAIIVQTDNGTKIINSGEVVLE